MELNEIMDEAQEFVARAEAGDVTEMEMLQVKAEATISVLELEGAIDAFFGEDLPDESKAALSQAIVTFAVMQRLEQAAMMEQLNALFAGMGEDEEVSPESFMLSIDDDEADCCAEENCCRDAE